jgi:tight adherence protein C
MILIIWASVFTAAFLVIYGVELLWGRRQRVKSRAGESGALASSPLFREKGHAAAGLQEKFMEFLAKSGQWLTPDMEKITEMRMDLIRAGYRNPQAVTIYLGIRIVTAFAITLPLILFFIVRGKINIYTMVIALIVAVFAFFLPVKVLAVKIQHRKNRLDKSLPDILDMFVICMEAGLSLNASLQRVSEETREVYQDFSDELQIVAGEVRTGIPWTEAFDNMAKRTDVQSIRSMVGLMIQSQKLGASIGEALRHQSEFVRVQRILRAEERAAKLPVKIIFPLIFCILPAILIVVAGPGLLQMVKLFIGGGLASSMAAPGAASLGQ